MSFLTKPISVLYEDEHISIFDKPAGLLAVPTPQNESNTLVNIVNHQYASAPGAVKLSPCHRLDRETSGAIIFARGKVMQEQVMTLFKNHQVKKTYILFVQGHVTQSKGEIRKDIEGKKSTTRYKVKSYKKHYTVVEAEPLTGRTNQIRIHFSQIGHPLIGDRKFSFARDYKLQFRRTALHAQSVEFIHPVTRKKIFIQSPLPQDMEVFLERNRN